jgi:ring-1,2-phenylacetyl-CoA epoxidase subunit PaaD
MVKTIQEEILEILQEVKDPEIPVISVVELGIIRNVVVRDDAIDITITPTYSGCPAMDVIPVLIKDAVVQAGHTNVNLINALSPAWTTDWITPEGRAKLEAYGIAPPDIGRSERPEHVSCPRCGSRNTELISFFGSTPCKAAYKCTDCLEPFDYFKCH